MGYTLKNFVSVLMTPELEKIVTTVDNVLHGYGLHAVITSGNDGQHHNGSLHYRNQALDFRIFDWTDVPEIVKVIKLLLGKNYDVVLETSHLHIEYDPKGP